MAPCRRLFTNPLLMMVLISVVAGMAGCNFGPEPMPVPLGDSEKSRVDSWFDGLWLHDENVFVFEPYDKRTWLGTAYEIDDRDCVEPDDPGDVESDAANQLTLDDPGLVEIIPVESAEYDYAMLAADLRARGPDCLDGELILTFKVWLTEIGKAEFMTWELKGAFDKDTGFVPQGWLAMRVIRLERDEFRLQFIDPGFDGFDEPDIQAKLDKLNSEEPRKARALAQARGEIERMIRRNIDNEDLYFGDGEDEYQSLLRIQPQDYDIFIDNVVPSP